MYVITCPRCGKETPISLVSAERMTCTSCDYVGPVDPGTASRLRAAAQLVRGLGARQRQLSGLQRRAVAKSGCMTATIVVLAVLLLIPALGFGACSIVLVGESGASWFSALMLAVGLAPVVVLALFGGGGLLWLRRSRRTLRAAASAEPPASPGGAARCRLCGADLPPPTGSVSRCAFCEADNLVEPELLGKMTAERRAALDDIARVVDEGVRAVQRAAVHAVVALVGALVVGPVVVVVLFVAGAIVLSRFEAPPDLSLRYALVPQGDRARCAARVLSRDDGQWALNYWDAPPPGAPNLTVVPDLSPYEVVTADWFVGRTVLAPPGYGTRPRGSVERITANLFSDYPRIVVDGDDYQVEGLCLVEDPGPAPQTGAGSPPPAP